MEKPAYGNWFPLKLIKLIYAITAVVILGLISCLLFHAPVWLTILAAVASVICLIVSVYWQMFRNQFDFEKGGLMGRIHQYVVDYLDWDGKGKLLDVGCGSGALTIRLAKRFQQGSFIGMDYWGFEWDYSQKLCQQNAAIEGVENRCTFVHGDARKLDFADESMDAVVSNFVFHEVKSEPDKRLLVKESLRVLKPGGAFAFHDLFEQKSIYGDIQTLIEELRQSGISEVNYIARTQDRISMPAYMKLPWGLTGLGLIYGKK